MDPNWLSDVDTSDQHLNATGTIDCSPYSPTCNNYNPYILGIFIVGISVLVLLFVVFWYAVRSHYKKKAARQQQQRRASQILPLYLGSNQDVAAPGAVAGEDIQLRRLSRRVSIPLPMNVQRQRSGAEGGGNVEVMDSSPRSVGSNDTVVRHEVSRDSQSGVTRMHITSDNHVVLCYEPSGAVVNNDTVVLNDVSRSGVCRAPVRSESVDTLPRYEEVAAKGDQKKKRLSGGVGRAV